ncbi:hypothetical protein A3Q56_05800 [Intoshia linei]|uniref:Uncharacterized protein n=1 Tax=Intoshia linei TaxID=1819745 RepID=A0A177AYI5_9BILA|nr:hypothetical protein A3Q56_05800 [Intoshia linei]
MMSFVKKQSEMPTNRQYTIPYEWHQPQLYYQMNSYYPPENNPNQPRSNYNHDYGSIYPYYY